MLPVGKYTATALRAELGFADTGTELVAVQFEIKDGEHKGDKITWRGYFTEKTSRRVIESLKHTGWSGNWDTWEGLGSEEVQLDVAEDRDMKTGEIRGTRVAWVNQLRAPTIKNSMDDAQRKQFSAKMRGLVTEVLSTPAQQPQGRSTLPFRSQSAARPDARQGQPARVWSSGAKDTSVIDAEPAFEGDDLPFLGRIKSMGWSHGEHWSDELFEERLIQSAEKFGRMPTANELIASGDNALACAIPRFNGYRKVAQRLGLQMKDCETTRAHSAEAALMTVLESKGYTVERQSTRAPFDLLVNGVRVDVKSSRFHSYKHPGKAVTSSGYFFQLSAKPERTCDVYTLCCMSDSDTISRVFFVPWEFSPKHTITITPTGKKYISFLDNYSPFHPESLTP